MISTSPRIYVACLASYNNGILHGRWIDADQSAHDIRAEIAEMLAESSQPGAEEYAIHDYEGFFGLRIEEYTSIDDVAELAELIAEHGEAYAAYASYVGSDSATAECFQDAYCGQWDSEQAYAEQLFDELYLHDVPEHLQCYIDYERFARDLFLGDMFSVDADEGGVHVFYAQ